MRRDWVLTRMTYRFTSVEHDLKLDVYRTTKCAECPIRARCTTGDIRSIKQWENEGVVDAMLQRLEAGPDSMSVRRRTVEHPFGTLKSWSRKSALRLRPAQG